MDAKQEKNLHAIACFKKLVRTYLVQTVRFRHKLNLSHESTSPFTIELEHLSRRI